MRGYDAIKSLGKATGRTIPDLLVLARQNDPFFAGSEASRAKAEWFAELWQRFGFTTGVHLRRVHYRLVTLASIAKHTGERYENNKADWSYLGEAGKAARYLGLISPDAFIDRRNPAPHVFDDGTPAPASPGWGGGEPSDWTLPNVALAWDVRLGIQPPWVDGYEYDISDQPYLVELWVEKSTMDDVLLPVCQELGVNLVTSEGFQSITSVRDLLRRVGHGGRGARVLYISDYDPAGSFMPQAVARQIEYWLPDYAPGADVKLEPLVMTRDQVITYRLPRTPIEGKDRRKAGFEERHGEGATELDALEALYPGELARIVRNAVLSYRDLTLPQRLAEADAAAVRAARTAWAETVAPFEDDLTALEDQAQAIVDRYRPDLERLNEAMQAELGPIRERLQALRHDIQTAVDDLEIALPERPAAEIDAPDESAWLFDAGRDYLAQLAIYKARQDTEGAVAE